MKRTAIIETISLLLILLFVYAATSKLLDYQNFKIQLGQSPLLTSIAGFVAWFIPAVEICIALMLLISKFRLTGLYASLTLMTMFTAYIFILTHFSSYVPCSCGGVLQKMTWNQHFVFNVVFVLLTIAAIFRASPPQQVVLKNK